MRMSKKLTGRKRLGVGGIKKGQNMGNKNGFIKGMIAWNRGKNLSKEHKQKLSEAHKGKKFDPIRKKRQLEYLEKQFINKQPTSIEKIVYDLLKSKGIIFEKQKLISGRFLVDVYIPELKLIIECDGNYWHNLERVVKKDKAENAYLTKCGFNLIRLNETEINNGSFKERLRI